MLLKNMLTSWWPVCLKLCIDTWYLVATKAAECHDSVIQHSVQCIMFLLQPKGFRVWETNSMLFVPQYAITIHETWMCLKCPPQSTRHIEHVGPSKPDGLLYSNLFRLCACIKLNYTSRVPVVLILSCCCGTLTIICWLQPEINPWKLRNLFFLFLYINSDNVQECQMSSSML